MDASGMTAEHEARLLRAVVAKLALAFGFRTLYLRPRGASIALPSSRLLWAGLIWRTWRLRALTVTTILSYAITWTFGVPSVSTAIIANDLASAKQVAEYYEEPILPIESAVTFAVAVVPGVVVAYHYHLGGRLHGWGGWKLYAWYVTGEHQLFELVRWVT